jgi:Plasmid encoded RepA protein
MAPWSHAKEGGGITSQNSNRSSGLTHIADILPKIGQRLLPLTPIKQRLADGAGEIAESEPESILYQHTVLCQTGMPYRNPGEGVRVWDRSQGLAHLRIEAGSALHPESQRFVDIGLPFGPKPRIILAFLNAEALRTQSPLIEVEGTLTAFVTRIGLNNGGRNILVVKDQLARLAAARVMLGMVTGPHRAATMTMPIVQAFDLWFPKNENQRVLWPSTVRLSEEYFKTLCAHAVPLDERAIANLSNSAMGLDIYMWLAQRLHRVPPAKPQFIPWTAIKEQFGWNYGKMFKFKEVFRDTLRSVKTQYPAGLFTIDGRGMTLFNSPPPVAKRVHLVSRAPAPDTPRRPL